MKILLCGGGNAVHVLASLIGAQQDNEVTILSLFPREAGRLRNAIPKEGIQCINDIGDDVYGSPVKVTACVKDFAKEDGVDNDIDVVILALPSFAHELYLKALKPYLRPGLLIGAMPGEGGFDLLVRHILGDNFITASNIFALETLPWACRIVEYGRSVEILGTKKQIDVVVSPKEGAGNTEMAIKVLQGLMGRLPVLKATRNFLAVTLMNPSAIGHPAISFGYFHDKDVTKPFDEKPLYYQGADEYTGNLLDRISDEVLEIKRVLMEKYPGLDLSSIHHMRDLIVRYYGDDIQDKSSLHRMLQTNKGYRGLKHPMKAVDTFGGMKYLPDFNFRYFSEDIPMGLIVTRGIAELAGVPTPNMDIVILW
eukprot:CAMPEP_0168165820 /NCGR_PEP_ID=MMETSP0139_2-20121125/1687_1 /TAXON_ID=44445 /ORGANISM="Pseudo-nitzschia australis, Strain 10249 10 AB" /LENGTH=366 /DNA_ID=CAMNT_0008082955 /DNA_START=424 /DNA_END=1521 /DNA_ORIENTATION=+